MPAIYDWISIGGGAAGFYGALQFSEQVKSLGRECRALILEASPQVLSKVKISGGGRCNITHHCFDSKKLTQFYPRGERELLSVFARYQPKDVWEWFEARGLRMKIEEDGRIFPSSDDSQSVIDIFQKEARRLAVDILLKKAVSKIERNEAGLFVLESADGESFTTKNLLVASGSNRKIWDLLSEMGLSIVEPVPSLFSFNIRDRRIQDLSGRSFKDVEISCSVGKESFSTRGPLLITHWGLSGPAILKLSAWAARALATVNYSTTLKINFLPEVNRQTLSDRFRELRTSEAKKKIKNYLLKGMNSNYWDAVLSYLNFPKEMMWAEVSNHQLEKLADEVLRAEFKTKDKTTNKDEFVTAGGVSLKEIDFKTMMAKKIPHLYFAGEVLNIDGITGGFNFQSAWSTSAVAAKAAITLENGSGSD